jgi:hypothetical protein
LTNQEKYDILSPTKETIQNECKVLIVGDRGEVTYVWKAGEKIARGFNAKIVGIYIKQTRKFLLRNL